MSKQIFEREYHRIRKAKTYIRRGVWGTDRNRIARDWAYLSSNFRYPYYHSYRRRYQKTYSEWTPLNEVDLLELDYWEAQELGQQMNLRQAKKLTEKGCLLHGNKKLYRKKYNRVRRKLGKEYCNLVLEDRLDEADFWISSDKDKSYWYTIY